MNVNIENNIPDTEEYEVTLAAKRTPIRIKGTDTYFYMDFGDTDFPNRLLKGRKEIAEFFESKREELGVENITDVKIRDYSVEEIEHILEVSKEIDNFIKNQINNIFGYDVCKDVFGIASSISVSRQGEYYFDNFLNSVLPIVEKEYDVRINATNERIKKYTDQKGKHKNPYIKR